MTVQIKRGESTYEWLREQSEKVLAEKFPDLKDAIKSEHGQKTVTEFVAGRLAAWGVPIRLDLYEDADQYRLLKEKGLRAFEFRTADMEERSWLYYRRLLEKDYKRAKNVLLYGLDVETNDQSQLHRLLEKNGVPERS